MKQEINVYCKECGFKYERSVYSEIPIIPPDPPKWKRPKICANCRYTCCVAFACSEPDTEHKLHVIYEKEEKEILEKFRRWESDKKLKELKPDWLEYCIRRYTIKNVK